MAICGHPKHENIFRKTYACNLSKHDWKIEMENKSWILSDVILGEKFEQIKPNELKTVPKCACE